MIYEQSPDPENINTGMSNTDDDQTASMSSGTEDAETTDEDDELEMDEDDEVDGDEEDDDEDFDILPSNDSGISADDNAAYGENAQKPEGEE